jgi:hypothetical protein
MTGLWISDTTTDTLTCYVADARFINHTSNVKLVYTVFSKQASAVDAPFIQQQGFAHFSKHQRLLLGCGTQGNTGPLTTIRAVTFAFHPIIAQPKKGKHLVLPKHSRLRQTSVRP